MKKYEEIIYKLDDEKIYSHNELVSMVVSENPNYNYNSGHWAVEEMKNSGLIIKSGYNSYKLNDGTNKKIFTPSYSDLALKFIDKINNSLPDIEFMVFESTQLNVFLKHLIAKNTIFIYVEKDLSQYVFHFLQEERVADILYRPTNKDFYLYWNDNCVVIDNLVSEAPQDTANKHLTCLEKMLVDIYCDKIMSTLFSKNEYKDILKEAYDKYRIDEIKMLRYASRRGKKEEIRKEVEEIKKHS